MKKILLSIAALGALAVATPALANVPDGTEIGGCSTTLTNPNATACDGYFTGNILNGSSTDVALQQEAITDLGGSWDGNWNNLSTSGLVITSLSGSSSNQLNFGQTLFGTVIIGAHYGNVPGPDGNVSVFWLFNLTSPTNFITLTDTQGWSNAALYVDGPHVPEPATWAMMVLGFGAAGFAMRRSRRKQQPLTQLA